MSSIVKKLKQNKKIHFLVKMLKHINQDDYLDFFINRENNALLLEFETRGSSCEGKRIYLIKEAGKGYGFFAEFHTLLQKLAFAECFGLTPYMEWNQDFLYHEEEPVEGTGNGFEYFYMQPEDFTKQQIEKADLITEAKMGQASWIEQRYERGYDLSEPYLKMISDVYNKYIHLNQKTERMLNKAISGLLKDKMTLAVHYRGTDFKVNYDNHPVCVQVAQEIDVIKKAMQQYGFEQIFLATDDLEAINAFKTEFGETVIYYTDVVRGEGNVSVAFSNEKRQHHHYLLAYEVLRDMYTLSACQGLVAGVSQVSICARIAKRARNEKYQFEEIIDNGKNYNNKKFKPTKSK